MLTVYTGPYKLIALHQGTRRRHWHLIYISRNKQWGFNSRLGRIIRNGAYKNSSINCVPCLRQYLYTGNGRQVLQDILSKKHVEACQCASHSCGLDSLDPWTKAAYEIECAEGGNSILGNEGGPLEEEHSGMVNADPETDERLVRKRPRSGTEVQCENVEILYGGKMSKFIDDNRKDCSVYGKNSNSAFMRKQCFLRIRSYGNTYTNACGIEFIGSKQYAERIKNYVHIARILVFQESIKQRFERTKMKFASNNVMSEELLDNALTTTNILKINNIDEQKFAMETYKHYCGKSGKRNNLFFYGPPSTGKTMVMTSLVDCQFNYCRLTELTPNSSFNFSGLLHCNACFMDECKLTENQFEQWKLLASGMPMSTDVKYKDRCNVNKCILYTCSNYPIDMYCKVPMARLAVEERTTKFEFRTPIHEYVSIPPHVWEKLWSNYNFIM